MLVYVLTKINNLSYGSVNSSIIGIYTSRILAEMEADKYYGNVKIEGPFQLNGEYFTDQPIHFGRTKMITRDEEIFPPSVR